MSNLLKEIMGFIGREYLENSTDDFEQENIIIELAEKKISPDFDHITVI